MTIAVFCYILWIFIATLVIIGFLYDLYDMSHPVTKINKRRYRKFRQEVLDRDSWFW